MIPAWIEAFDRDPKTALEEAFEGRFYFGALNTVDPDQLIWQWAVHEATPAQITKLDEGLGELITAAGNDPRRLSILAHLVGMIGTSKGNDTMSKSNKALLAL